MPVRAAGGILRKRNNPSCAVRLDNTIRISELEYLRRQVHYFLPGFCPEPMLLTGKCAIGLLHIYMCCGCDWFTQIVVEKSFLFSKNILMRLILMALIFPCSFALFLLPFIGISYFFGHTGITGTKKWLDQAVFPCWSNYHTLAGE